MGIEGRVVQMFIDGYERLTQLDVNAINKKLWVHFIQHEEYLEQGEQSKILTVGQYANFEVGIDLASVCIEPKYVMTDTNAFIQPIDESSHVIVTANVVDIEDDYSIVCSIKNLGEAILVEFEEKINVGKGERITFKGNLKADQLAVLN
ncbi:hypothetical protein PCCS19_33110 [Paenibacillus sp. CCS19]|uniref:hypothetical protein n=1 Tax=Paenibacillus sp. CCS19 TaxID=3158387 RepID=UPI00255E0DC9|nr:hypothetical protein [Paenibacillus cellulosilyticus]GMK40256.1 hypothetical protein PCCS19_33110 [Paenibacillus cellulosilyticus]